MSFATGQLLARHREQLHQRGLTDATIEAAGLCTENSPPVLANLLNWKKWPAKMGAVIVIPYRMPDGTFTGKVKLRPDCPRKRAKTDGTNRDVKYEWPKGARALTYFPPGMVDVLADAKSELIITEGEFKSLVAKQEGFACISLSGVSNFVKKGSTELLPDLEAIAWQGRKTYIAFDSDFSTNQDVMQAAMKLAGWLIARGSDVRMVYFQDGENGEKVGLDDYLVDNGHLALRKLLDEAQPPEDVSSGLERIQAKNIDSMPYAAKFIEEYATRDGVLSLRFWRGEWWGWTGKKYMRLPDADLRAKVTRFLHETGVCNLVMSATSNVIDCLRSLALVHWHTEMPVFLDEPSTGEFIAMGNGILDVNAALDGKADCLSPHTARWFSPTCLPYPYDPAATCPKFLSVLGENLEYDQQRILLVQEWSGLIIIYDQRFHKFLILHGEGGTGKSVLLAVLMALVGVDNVSSVGLESFVDRFRLFATVGKLANIVSEIGEIDKVAEGTLKALTSGSTIQFERKFRDPVDAAPTARFIFSTNVLPRFSDRSGGIWRRVCLLPFQSVVPAERKIVGMDQPSWWNEQGELPGIFNWALEGRRRLNATKRFTEPDICAKALDRYRLENNPAKQFLLEQYHADANGQVANGDIYPSYTAWCQQNGYRALCSVQFGKEISRAFPLAKGGQKVTDRMGHSRMNGYVGFAWTPPET